MDRCLYPDLRQLNVLCEMLARRRPGGMHSSISDVAEWFGGFNGRLEYRPGGAEAQSAAAGTSSYDSVATVLAANDSTDFGKLATLADSLAAKAPELAGILRSSSIRTQVDIYTRLNAEAVLKQTRFMHELTTANICLMATGVLSGLVLVVGKLGSLIDSPSVRSVSLILGGAILVLGAWAAMLTNRLWLYMTIQAA